MDVFLAGMLKIILVLRLPFARWFCGPEFLILLTDFCHRGHGLDGMFLLAPAIVILASVSVNANDRAANIVADLQQADTVEFRQATIGSAARVEKENSFPAMAGRAMAVAVNQAIQ